MDSCRWKLISKNLENLLEGFFIHGATFLEEKPPGPVAPDQRSNTGPWPGCPEDYSCDL